MNEKDKEAINLLLTKEQEIINKFHGTISEVMRLGYETDRGKAEIDSLIGSVKYTLEDLQRFLNR